MLSNNHTSVQYSNQPSGKYHTLHGLLVVWLEPLRMLLLISHSKLQSVEDANPPVDHLCKSIMQVQLVTQCNSLLHFHVKSLQSMLVLQLLLHHLLFHSLNWMLASPYPINRLQRYHSSYCLPVQVQSHSTHLRTTH